MGVAARGPREHHGESAFVRITVFTSNQSRHTSLIERLTGVADEVWAVRECSTVFPGQVADFFARSVTMQAYFRRVIDAEHTVFGAPRFSPPAVRELSLKMGDLNKVPMSVLAPALESDVYLVFGASYIKGPLIDFLVEHRCFNIHMGTSPYYRGSSTNFWALYDERPEYVGATIHMLTKGLDSGPMLFHAFPPNAATDAFELGMRAVKAGHEGFASRLADGTIGTLVPVDQDRSRELRYTRNTDFTDEVASEYLGRLMPSAELARRLASRESSQFLDPYFGEA